MSSSKRSRGRLYVYADESGNTGNNLFDPNQPTLWACCVISNKHVDALATATIKKWRRAIEPNELHGTTLGFSRIDTIAEEFCKLISRLNLSFHFIELDKSFHAALKFFDTVFDAGLNPEMSPLHYNVRACRMQLLFVTVRHIDVEDRKLFWSSLLSGDKTSFSEVVSHVRSRLGGRQGMRVRF
jgi:hypothetical protein